MSIKEGDRFSPEIWSLVGNPLPENLIDTYMRYVNSLPPHERHVILRAPNPNDGYVEISVKELREHLEERTTVGIHIAQITLKDTLREFTPKEREEASENPQLLIEATIRRLQEATESNSPIYF